MGSLCTLSAQDNFIAKYRNVLNVKNIPVDSKDLNSFAFCDLGSWFGFALPGEVIKEYMGSFPGPYLVTEGRWLSKSFIKFNLTESKTGKIIDFPDGKLVEISYYPGMLTQKYIVDDIYVELYLIFISNRTAVVKAQLSSITDAAHTVNISWNGNIFQDVAKLTADPEGVTVNLEKTSRKLYLHWGQQPGNKADAAPNAYIISNENEYTIVKGKYTSAYLFISQVQNETELKSEKALAADFLGFPKKYFDFNRIRWTNYLTKVLATEESWGDEPEYMQAAVKCLLTLINNWKSPLGALRHDGVIPSYSHNYFTGFWAWDSWKHAAALASFEPELAKNQMRAMFDFQNSKGMIPDCVFIDSTKNNWLDTKPPLAAWAVWKIFESTKDKSFLKEFYPRLVKYHKWWYDERDHNKNGLCEYGSTKDNREAALWESGMDNAIRFDDVKMLKNKEDAYSMDQESVDLNSYLYAEKNYLSKIAEVLDLKEDADTYIKEAEVLKKKIQDTFYDKMKAYFFDSKLEPKRLVEVYGPEGWIPLWAMIATPEQAESVRRTFFDGGKFDTKVPFPTVSADNPKIDVKGYWRGPVWLDQSYFAIMGMRNYGFTRNARRFTERTFDKIEGFVKSDKPIRENYNPLTGEGLEANNFSWSAAHLLLLWWGK